MDGHIRKNPPAFMQNSARQLKIDLTDLNTLDKRYTFRIRASLPNDPKQSEIVQLFDVYVHNTCNNGNSMVISPMGELEPSLHQVVILSKWASKSFNLEGLITSSKQLAGAGICVRS